MDIYSIPDFILARVIAAGGMLFSVLGCLLIGRRWNRFFGLSSETNGIVGSFLSVTGVFFGILFGLVIVSAWETYDKVGEIEQAEASALRQLYLAADAQGGAATTLKTLQRDYVTIVLQREWPAQKAGRLETVEYREGYAILRDHDCPSACLCAFRTLERALLHAVAPESCCTAGVRKARS